jgi:hypothetical protein
MTGKIDLAAKFARIDAPWRARMAAEPIGQEVTPATVEGAFPGRRHGDVDQMSLAQCGTIRLEVRESALTPGPGEARVVPRSVEHRPVAAAPAEVIPFAPSGARNTGNVEGAAVTVPTGARI